MGENNLCSTPSRPGGSATGAGPRPCTGPCPGGASIRRGRGAAACCGRFCQLKSPSAPKVTPVGVVDAEKPPRIPRLPYCGGRSVFAPKLPRSHGTARWTPIHNETKTTTVVPDRKQRGGGFSARKQTILPASGCRPLRGRHPGYPPPAGMRLTGRTGESVTCRWPPDCPAARRLCPVRPVFSPTGSTDIRGEYTGTPAPTGGITCPIGSPTRSSAAKS